MAEDIPDYAALPPGYDCLTGYRATPRLLCIAGSEDVNVRLSTSPGGLCSSRGRGNGAKPSWPIREGRHGFAKPIQIDLEHIKNAKQMALFIGIDACPPFGEHALLVS